MQDRGRQVFGNLLRELCQQIAAPIQDSTGTDRRLKERASVDVRRAWREDDRGITEVEKRIERVVSASVGRPIPQRKVGLHEMRGPVGLRRCEPRRKHAQHAVW